MMDKFCFVSFLFAVQAFAALQTLIVKVPYNTPPGENIYITGEGTCNWIPNCIPLTKIAESVYHGQWEFNEQAKKIEINVTRGSWDKGASDALGKPIHNIGINTNPSQPFVYSVINWTDLKPLGITGTLAEVSALQSPQLNNNRKVRVWLPSSYALNPEKRYRVIYMHDGQNLFDPKTSYAGIDWGIDETLTELSKASEKFDAIVVGLDCTEDREAEYDYSKKGPLYADFLIHTAKKYVDSKYRTLPDRLNTYTMGSSMGALISFSLLWAHPEVFSKAAGVSFPAFYEKSFIFNLFEKFAKPTLPIQFYMDHGDYRDDKEYAPEASRFYSHLKTLGFPENAFQYEVFPWAEHNETEWARRAYIPLKFLLD